MNKRAILAVVLLGGALSSCNQRSAEAVNTSAEMDDITASDSNALIYCETVHQRLRQDDCDDLTRASDAAKAGSAAFNAPSPMWRGKTVTLQLAIGLEPPPETVAVPDMVESDNAVAENAADTLPDAADNAAHDPEVAPSRPTVAHPSVAPETAADVVKDLPGEVRAYSPVVGNFMRAELSGEGFDIVPKSPAEQAVVTGSHTTWEWSVTARQSGNQILVLKTMVVGKTQDGKSYVLVPTTQNQKIEVKVTRVDQVMDLLDFLPGPLAKITAILTGLAALIAAGWAVRRAIRGKPPKAGE